MENIPSAYNHDLSKFLELGHDIFETRIQRISKEENPENQIQVIIYLLTAKTGIPVPQEAGS